ncbi:MAG: hypothetical protein P1P85_02330 [Patescibacteria group bacterium]|nr:hypothetical protein [Patescibacteria group bacterium]
MTMENFKPTKDGLDSGNKGQEEMSPVKDNRIVIEKNEDLAYLRVC